MRPPFLFKRGIDDAAAKSSTAPARESRARKHPRISDFDAGHAGVRVAGADAAYL